MKSIPPVPLAKPRRTAIPRAARTALALAAALGACTPVVTHGPRVEPGLVAGATAGTRALLCDTCGGGVIPMWGAYARYGWVPATPGRPSAQVGVAVPSFDRWGAQADVYVQAPAAAQATVAGAGALVSPRFVVPYLQIGRVLPGGSGWYTTQGFALHGYTDEGAHDDEVPQFDYVETSRRYWMPMVARRAVSGKVAFSVYLGGAFGSFRERQYVSSEDRLVYEARRPLRVLMLGVAVETRISQAPWEPRP